MTEEHKEPVSKSDSENSLLLKNISLLSTALSFQQSRLAAERTLMANIRTSLALTGFGFALYQFYRYLEKEDPNVPYDTIPRNFGLSLTVLGMITVILGIIYHIRFINQISMERELLKEKGVLPSEDKFPVSTILIIAIMFLFLNISAIISMFLQIKLV